MDILYTIPLLPEMRLQTREINIMTTKRIWCSKYDKAKSIEAAYKSRGFNAKIGLYEKEGEKPRLYVDVNERS